MCFSVYCLYTGYFLLHMYLENSNIMTSILLLYIYIHVYPCIYIYIFMMLQYPTLYVTYTSTTVWDIVTA